MARKKIEVLDGDLFALPLKDEEYVLGQVLDSPGMNSFRIVLYNTKFKSFLSEENFEKFISKNQIITSQSITREQLERGIWKIIKNSKLRPFNKNEYPNEDLRSNGWIGASFKGGGIIYAFANAYFGLFEWDGWYAPDFFDKMLYDITKKPTNLIYKEK